MGGILDSWSQNLKETYWNPLPFCGGRSGSDRASQIELAISQMEALNHELVGLAAPPGFQRLCGVPENAF